MRKFLFVFAIALAIGTQLSATVTATWDWQHSIPTSITSVVYQYTTGSVLSNVSGVSMFVDATSGKLQANGDNAMFNAGTKLHIPVVSTLDVVTFTPHPYNYKGVTIGEDDYDGSSAEARTHTATADEVAQGYVEIISKGDYIYSVSVELAYKPATKTVAKWDWQNDNPSGIRAATQYESTTTTLDITSTINTIKLTCVTGKFTTYGTNPHVQFNIGSIIRVPVTSTTDVVSVKQYDAGSLLFGASETSITDILAEYTATAADVALGYVQIKQTRNSYIYSVTLEKGNYTLVTIGATGWATFSDASNIIDFTDLSGVVDAYTVIGHTGTAITKNAINATAPANTGLLLNAAAGTYALPFASSNTTDVASNLLQPGIGEAVSAEVGKTKYVLAETGTPAVATFLRIDATPATVPVGKAYLEFNEEIASAPAALRIVEEESGATNINAVDATEDAVKFFQNGNLYIKKNGVIYDMLGSVVR